MRSARPEPSIAAVVVTFNRFELLKECIAALRAQTRSVDEIIVIDNGSTDDTAAWLAEQAGLHVITQANEGSSGGQYAGIKAAYARGHDWIWCMDDDTIPDAEALERMTEAPAFAKQDTGFLASVPLWTDREPHPLHEMHPTDAVDWCGSVLDDRCIRVQMTTFVSVLIARRAVEAVGLPIRSFFIIGDDYEYTDRISQRFAGYAVLDSKVMHKTARRQGPPNLWAGGDLVKACYHARNQVSWIMRRPGHGFSGRVFGVLGNWIYYTRLVLLGRAHPRLLWWLLRGMFFRYRIESV